MSRYVNGTFNLPDILNGSPNHSITASRLGTHIDGELPNLWGYVNAAGLMDYRSTPYTNYCDAAGVFGCYIDNNNGWGWIRNSSYSFRLGGNTASTISLGFSAQKAHTVYKRTDNVVMPQSTFIGGWLIKYI